MSFFQLLHQQIQVLDLLAVLFSGRHNIDAGCLDAAVAQDVCQQGDVLFHGVKGPGEELAQVVGIDLVRLHIGRGTQPLHLRPDVAPIQAVAGPGHKNRAGPDVPPGGVAPQGPSQLGRRCI